MSDPTAGDVFRLGVRAKSLGFRLIDYPTIYLLWRIDESVPDYATQSGTAAEDVAEIVDEIERRPRYRLHLAGNPSVSTSQLVNGFVKVTGKVRARASRCGRVSAPAHLMCMRRIPRASATGSP